MKLTYKIEIGLAITIRDLVTNLTLTNPTTIPI